MRDLLTACIAFVALASCEPQVFAQPHSAVAVWNFDGTLGDGSGHGNDAYATSASFVPGHRGQGLRCGRGPVIVPDSPDLRPAPGLRLECWAKLETIGTGFEPLLIKDRAYQLRLDPPQEGGRFSFFLYLDGWEPRVRSKLPAKLGQWYHLIAGWDGKEIWIDVDGERASTARSGVPMPAGEPLELGLFDGVLDEVRIENPVAPPSGVAQWLFEGDLRDSSGHEHHLAGRDLDFVPAPAGKALKSGGPAVHVASHSDLQLAPGFRIDCSVRFDTLPAQTRFLAFKDGEYQLRLNSPEEGGCFAFFVNLDGWEPRVKCSQRVVPGQWYRLTAGWDGFALTLDVNGQRSRVMRSGPAKASDSPLVIGGPDVWIDHLRIENPRLPTLEVRRSRQEHAILVAGRPEKLSTMIRNLGAPVEQVAVRCQVPEGTRCLGQPIHELGTMPAGAEKTIEWSVEANTAVMGTVEIHVSAAGAPSTTARHPLVFFPSENGPPPSVSEGLRSTPVGEGKATIYYIDSVAGNNANAGTSPESPWKDFTNVNGRVLGSGDKLLLRRGSVFNQELNMTARGSADHWAEIGAYGSGARPIIRRNWDIDDRCALMQNPDFLHIHSLVVCQAAKGLIVAYAEPGHRGLLIEDCIAHHIEGLYRFNSHGIPEWRDRHGPSGEGLSISCGIAMIGTAATDLVLRDCEMFQCSSGYFASGNDVIVDRVFCHDNYVHNTSPHPFVAGVHRAVVRNSVFDAAGWHASAGTMGVMLGDPQGLIIRNCLFRNQPDSGSHDEGGVDFENSGNGCLIDRCTFENNAGAAIEVLGLEAPQTTNIEIRDSRFIKNNTAKKLGPSEIYVWGQVPDASVCCSTGAIQGNGFVLLPGVAFFINEAPRLTSWTLSHNVQYATAAELERAMPANSPPVVDAGPDIRTDRPRVALAGQVHDDGLPAGKPLSVTWEVLEGPGRVVFDDAHAVATPATFDQPGDYVLRLVADDGQLWTSDRVAVHILSPGMSVIRAWEFNGNLDKEGWTEVNPGTRVQEWPNPDGPTFSHPVKYVAGGYYVLAIENSPDAHLLSAEHLDCPLTGQEKIAIRFQNHTPATAMRVKFTTEADPAWADAKSRAFSVVADDNESRTYVVDLSTVAAWQGRLGQLRLDLATGKPLTGTCRIDYLWLISAAPGP